MLSAAALRQFDSMPARLLAAYDAALSEGTGPAIKALAAELRPWLADNLAGFAVTAGYLSSPSLPEPVWFDVVVTDAKCPRLSHEGSEGHAPLIPVNHVRGLLLLVPQYADGEPTVGPVELKHYRDCMAPLVRPAELSARHPRWPTDEEVLPHACLAAAIFVEQPGSLCWARTYFAETLKASPCRFGEGIVLRDIHGNCQRVPCSRFRLDDPTPFVSFARLFIEGILSPPPAPPPPKDKVPAERYPVVEHKCRFQTGWAAPDASFPTS